MVLFYKLTKIIPIIINNIASSLINMFFLLISSFKIFGKYNVVNKAKTKTSNGEEDALNALTSDTGPSNIAKSEIIKAIKSTVIFNPSNPFILFFIPVKVSINSFFMEGINKTTRATKLVSLSHKTALQNGATLKICLADTYATAIKLQK